MNSFVLIRHTALWCLALCLLCACTQEKDSEPFLSVAPETLTFTPGLTQQNFKIDANRSWTLDAGDTPWITVTPKQGGSGKTTVQVNLKANPSYAQRQCTLSIKIEGIQTSCRIIQSPEVQVPPGSQLAALIALYNNLDGPNWKEQTNWMSDKPIGEWKGIRTDDQGHVVVIYMYANNLSGVIPPEIGNFPYLEKLYLSHDALSGSIPESIGKLKNLQELDLTVNRLTGNIPASVTELTRLQKMALNDNDLTGPIPEEIGKLTEVNYLTLHKNRLHGSIPESLGKLGELETLNLSYNALSGSLPASMGEMQMLTSLQLQRNQLSGGLPESFVNLSALTSCDLSFNRFDGSIAAGVLECPLFESWIPSPQQNGCGFSNLNDNLQSDDYSQDGKVITYAEPKQGNGYNLVFMGDGFTCQDMGSDGLYERKMIQGIEALFKHEPYKSYRDYFNIYIVKVVSPQNGVSQPGYSRNSALGVTYAAENGTLMRLKEEAMRFYAAKTPPYAQGKPLVISVIANCKRHGGTAYFPASGVGNYAIGTLAGSFETTLVHELGGHAIGRLGDEYTGGHAITASGTTELKRLHDRGYYFNLELTNLPNKVRWNGLIGLPGYEAIGVYEGGYAYAYGVWRCENNSIMKQSGSGAGFNAYSRALIVQQILESAGESYSVEKFLAKDVIPPPPSKGMWLPDEESDHTPPVFLP